jgi:hypothetical protein
MSGRNNPLALLDALYERILSKIPVRVMVNTINLLLISISDAWTRIAFRFQCNILGLTEDAAYSAVRHLHAIMKASAPNEADDTYFTYFHGTFHDFLFDFKRTRFSRNIQNEAELIMLRISLRVVEQAPDNSDGQAASEGTECSRHGLLQSGPGFCDNISLSWPGDERCAALDHELRPNLYSTTMITLCKTHISSWTMSYLNALTTHFTEIGCAPPIRSVMSLIFVGVPRLYPIC